MLLRAALIRISSDGQLGILVIFQILLEAIRKLRRTMVDLNPIEAMETLTAALKKHKTNDELLAKLAVGS